MARPKKEKAQMLQHKVTVRFSDFELELLEENARNTGLRISDLIRKAVLGVKIQASYSLVMETPQIDQILAQYGKIGSNLNQIARHFNQGGIHSKAMRDSINDALVELHECSIALTEVLEEYHGNSKTHR